MTDAPKLQALLDDINRRAGNDEVTNLLSDMNDERERASIIIWELGELVTDPEIAKRLLSALRHLDENGSIIEPIHGPVTHHLTFVLEPTA